MNTGKTLLSVNQIRHHGHSVDDCPLRYGGQQQILTHQGHVIPLTYQGVLCRIPICHPTLQELESLIPEEITDPMPWTPDIEEHDPSERILTTASTVPKDAVGEGGSV